MRPHLRVPCSRARAVRPLPEHSKHRPLACPAGCPRLVQVGRVSDRALGCSIPSGTRLHARLGRPPTVRRPSAGSSSPLMKCHGDPWRPAARTSAIVACSAAAYYRSFRTASPDPRRTSLAHFQSSSPQQCPFFFRRIRPSASEYETPYDTRRRAPRCSLFTLLVIVTTSVPGCLPLPSQNRGEPRNASPSALLRPCVRPSSPPRQTSNGVRAAPLPDPHTLAATPPATNARANPSCTAIRLRRTSWRTCCPRPASTATHPVPFPHAQSSCCCCCSLAQACSCAGPEHPRGPQHSLSVHSPVTGHVFVS
jgi:hypothetical protein